MLFYISSNRDDLIKYLYQYIHNHQFLYSNVAKYMISFLRYLYNQPFNNIN